MKPLSNIAKRVLLATGLALLTACGSNGVTDPTAARKSGYLTVSAAVSTVKASGYNVPAGATTTTTTTTTVKPTVLVGPSAPTTSLGYNVPAN